MREQITQRKRTPANRLGFDYRALGATFLSPARLGHPIIDVHAHINGDRAAQIYRQVRELYGCRLTYSMTQFAQAQTVKKHLGSSVRFIAVPDYASDDLDHAFKEGFIERLTDWHGLGARMCKFWTAPRGRDYGRELGDPDLLSLTSPWRRKQIDHAASLGMMFMCHVADPDTWFAAKYTDEAMYGTKIAQYEPLKALLRETAPIPWILAHMGGWPEDLDFLDALLERHDNAYLDTSATKWMVRELSRHPIERVARFFEQWRGRILFGTDIVSIETHVGAPPTGRMAANPDVTTEDDAFDLYASRYWAQRTLLEGTYRGESPIADPDLELIDEAVKDELAAPELVGHGLPIEVLREVYFGAATALLDHWYERD